MWKTLLSFFLLNQLKNRKLMIIILLAAIPPTLAVLMVLLKSVFNQHQESVSTIFPNFTFLLYMHFVIPLIALFSGISVFADELEDKTLPFLIVRPVPKFMIILMKYCAVNILNSLIIFLSLTLSYIMLSAGYSVESIRSDLIFILHAVSVIIFALLVYSMLFTLFGGLFRHPIVLGIFFVFGWEKLLPFIPGNARHITIISYLQTIFPELPSSNIIDQSSLYSEFTAITAIIILTAILVITACLSCLLLYLKEFQFDVEKV